MQTWYDDEKESASPSDTRRDWSSGRKSLFSISSLPHKVGRPESSRKGTRSRVFYLCIHGCSFGEFSVGVVLDNLRVLVYWKTNRTHTDLSCSRRRRKSVLSCCRPYGRTARLWLGEKKQLKSMVVFSEAALESCSFGLVGGEYSISGP